MKLPNKVLLRALEGPAQLASKRTTLPVLNCVKLSATGGALTISGTNIDAYRKVSVECQGDLEPTCVHAAQLSKLLAEYGEDEIEVELNARGTHIRLIGRHNTNIPTEPYLSASGLPEFPDAPKFDGKEVKGDMKALATALSEVAWAASVAIDRQNLQGACARGEHACATDGRVLAEHKMEGVKLDGDLFVPSDVVDVFCSLLAQKDATLSIGETRIFIQTPTEVFSFKQSTLSFPQYRHIIPTDAKIIGKCSSEAIVDVMRPAVSLYDDKHAKTRFEFGPDGFVISQDSPRGEFRSTIPGEFKPLRFAVNGRWILSAAQKFKSEVEIHGVEEKAPLIIRNANMLVLFCVLPW